MSALLTDLYELTMAQAYYARGMEREAVFELTARGLPRDWNFLICAGVDRVLEHARGLRFREEELAYLASLPQFEPWFIERLRGFRFTGEIRAVAEGTAVFPPVPLLQVIGPLPEAQILETFALNQVSFATLIASKAARAVIAADGRPVVEFGGRRAHGTDAMLQAARAAYIAGFSATSSLEAGRRYGIPVTGTMGHSYVMAHEDEGAAFGAFAEQYAGATLLVDTYDTERGLERVIGLARERGAEAVGAVRIDSGDFEVESRRARGMLDAAGAGGGADHRERGVDGGADRGAAGGGRADRRVRGGDGDRDVAERAVAGYGVQVGGVRRAGAGEAVGGEGEHARAEGAVAAAGGWRAGCRCAGAGGFGAAGGVRAAAGAADGGGVGGGDSGACGAGDRFAAGWAAVAAGGGGGVSGADCGGAAARGILKGIRDLLA